MRWKGRARSTNVKDHRQRSQGSVRRPSGGGLGGLGDILGRSGGVSGRRRGRGLQLPIGKGGGGMGIGTMIVIGLILMALGINPLQFLAGSGLGGGLSPNLPAPQAQQRTQPLKMMR